MKISPTTCGAALGSLLLVVSLAACAPEVATTGTGTSGGGGSTTAPDDVVAATSAQEVIDSFDITTICPEENVTLAFPAGITNPWMKSVHKMIENEAAKCDTIDEVIMTDAQLDPQKAASDINSLVAQGVAGITAIPIFGEAQLPSIRSAVTSGIPFTTFVSDPGGAVPTDVTAKVDLDHKDMTDEWLRWTSELYPDGAKVVFLGGNPGQPGGVARQNALLESAKDYPGIEVVEQEMTPTNNSHAGKLQAMSGLLAKHGRIDAVFSDDGNIDTAVLDAYAAAGFEPPAIASTISPNGMACAWEEANFPYQSWDGQQTLGVIAFRKMVAAVSGLPEPEPDLGKGFVVWDTENGKNPTCDPTLSPDTDFSTNLTTDELREVFGSA
jgi:ribose transport system substrate-binding protein